MDRSHHLRLNRPPRTNPVVPARSNLPRRTDKWSRWTASSNRLCRVTAKRPSFRQKGPVPETLFCQQRSRRQKPLWNPLAHLVPRKKAPVTLLCRQRSRIQKGLIRRGKNPLTMSCRRRSRSHKILRILHLAHSIDEVVDREVSRPQSHPQKRRKGCHLQRYLRSHLRKSLHLPQSPNPTTGSKDLLG